MSERQEFQEKCANCPNRGKLSKVIAKIVSRDTLADGCKGPVNVKHGEIQTRLVYSGQMPPNKKDFAWNSVTGPARGSDGPERYSRTEWTKEDVCGREEIVPLDGEVPYSLDRPTWTNADGSRHAAFIKGNEEEMSDHRAMQGIMALLDATTEMEDAEDEGDVEGAAQAVDKIAEYGFAKPVSAGRRGSGKKKA